MVDMLVTKVSPKGQIVIPKALREKYGIKPEGRVLIAEINGRIGIVPLLEDPVKEARGALKGGRSLTRALLTERQAEREREEKLRAR
jgi:AbrB family looped-hinge helix DNA binding protein